MTYLLYMVMDNHFDYGLSPRMIQVPTIVTNEQPTINTLTYPQMLIKINV